MSDWSQIRLVVPDGTTPLIKVRLGRLVSTMLFFATVVLFYRINTTTTTNK
jgi:hypothetical protein